MERQNNRATEQQMDRITQTPDDRMDVEKPIDFEVPKENDRQRADRVLADAFPQWSRSRLQRLFDEGRVWLDNEAISKSRRVSSGDFLSFSFPPASPSVLRPRAIPLDILFEDDDVLVVNKHCGMVVHPGNSTGEDTLVHALLHYCGERLSSLSGRERPGIVHRLDKETSGVIVVAKTDVAFQSLSAQFSMRSIEKEYIAICSGVPATDRGVIREPIGRHPRIRMKMAVIASGRPAHSEWRRVSVFGNRYSLLKISIHTGRTHQIRVHLSWIGHPVAGDSTYGYRAAKAFPRTMLHAQRITFSHPLKDRRLALEAEPPTDFSVVVRDLRKQFCSDSKS